MSSSEYELIGSRFAKELLEQGFMGNGCGSKRFDRILATIGQWLVGVDFSPACQLHDAEMNILRGLKTEPHRLVSDSNFEYNCIMCMEGQYTTNKFRLAQWFHAIIVLHTFDIYWQVGKNA
jgi:thiamine pyrophosphokinase